MEFRTLGGSGLKVSVLALGTSTFGGVGPFFGAWGTTNVEQAQRLLGVAGDAGVNLVDCADSYSRGVAEEILGKALIGQRERWIVATKASSRVGPGINEIGSSRHHLVASCEASLRRLRTDHVDLWQMHGFDATTPIEESLRAIDDLVTAGKVRYAGCSNFSGWQLMKSLGIADHRGRCRYVSHQVYYSLIAREYEWELLPLGLAENVGALIWSPLSGGQLTGKIGPGRPAPAGSRFEALGSMGPPCPEDRFFRVIEALETVATQVGRSVSEVAINWLLYRPTVSSVILGVRNEEQLRNNLGAALFRLDTEQVELLERASSVLPTYPYWHQWIAMRDRTPQPVPIQLPPLPRL